MQEGQADLHYGNGIDLGITHMRFVHAVSAIKQINKDQYAILKLWKKKLWKI